MKIPTTTVDRSAGSRMALAARRIVATMPLLAIVPLHAQTLPYTEDFTTTTFEDAAATSADGWGTGSLKLPMSNSLTGVTFDDTTAVEVLPGKYQTRDVALADFDGDGDLDLVETIFGADGIYLNDGTGTFGTRVYASPLTGANTRGVAVGDVDRDGDVDFVTADRNEPVHLYLNDGTGTAFELQNVSDGPNRYQSVALADLDNDGLLDVVAATLDFRNNYVYWNIGDPTMPFGPNGQAGTVLDLAVKEETRDVAVGDIDNDGDVDIVFFNESEANPNDGNRPQRNRVYLNLLSQGEPRKFVHFEIEPTGLSDVDSSRGGDLGDLNGDGFLDLVVINFETTEQSKIYLNSGAGDGESNPFTVAATTFTIGGPNSDPTFASGATLADSDKDGDLDIFMTIAGHGFRNRVYLNDGAGNITGFQDVGPIGQAPLVLTHPTDIAALSTSGAVGDVDGDGDLDWVVGNADSNPTGPMQNMLLRNTGSTAGGVATQQLRAQATSLTVDTAGTGSVKLTASTTGVGAATHTGIDYWVTGNGGTTWTPIAGNGRPVLIAAGSDVRWRAEMSSQSPATAAALSLNQVDITANASGPAEVTPVGDQIVVEGNNVGERQPPIVANFADPDGDTLYYTLEGLPAGSGLYVDGKTGQLVGFVTDVDSQASPMTLTFSATDGAFLASGTPFELSVTNTNDSPSFTTFPPNVDPSTVPASVPVTQDVLFTYNITATDPDPGDTAQLVIEATNLPSWLTLTDNGGGSAVLEGTPSAADVFSTDTLVTLIVRDPVGGSAEQNFNMVIANVNDAPTITSSPVTTADEGALYSYTVTVEDLDMDPVTIAATTLPSWLSITDNGDGTATISGTPAGSDIGTHSVVIEATEDTATAESDSQSFDINVAASPDGPVITLNGAASVTIRKGDTYTDAGATAMDAQDGDLTDQIVSSGNVNTGTAGTYTITYEVSDSAGNTATARRTVIVEKKKSGGGATSVTELLVFGLMALILGLRRNLPLQLARPGAGK